MCSMYAGMENYSLFVNRCFTSLGQHCITEGLKLKWFYSTLHSVIQTDAKRSKGILAATRSSDHSQPTADAKIPSTTAAQQHRYQGGIHHMDERASSGAANQQANQNLTLLEWDVSLIKTNQDRLRYWMCWLNEMSAIVLSLKIQRERSKHMAARQSEGQGEKIKNIYKQNKRTKSAVWAADNTWQRSEAVWQ